MNKTKSCGERTILLQLFYISIYQNRFRIFHYLKQIYNHNQLNPNGNPFTVVAFFGQEENHGVIVLELPRDGLDGKTSDRNWIYLGTFFLLFFAFIVVSLLFFRHIRKRLLNLQTVMDLRDEDTLPVLTHVKKDDEIGELETAFNKMVSEQRESREREQQEEQLRRELIANISHDLRTPLTKMRAQTHAILKEELSDEGREAVQRLDGSIDSIDRSAWLILREGM